MADSEGGSARLKYVGLLLLSITRARQVPWLPRCFKTWSPLTLFCTLLGDLPHQSLLHHVATELLHLVGCDLCNISASCGLQSASD